jgi:hypothetical protein
MITIYQIQVTAEDVDRYNAGVSVPAIEAKREVGFRAKNFTSDMLKYYTEAYRVYTDDLEEAFEITNLWNKQEKVDVIGDNGSSTSVGDIFRLNERFYMVDSFGFKELRLFDDEVAMLEGWEYEVY